jgi:Na+/phosphate symporter
MRKTILCALFIICLSLVVIGADAPDADKVNKLINQLASTEKPERDAVSNELINMGEAIKPLLEEALKNSDETIVKRVKIVLRKINQKKQANNFDASTVTCTFKDKPVKEVLEVIQIQTGNFIKLGKINDANISVDFKSTPYWQALDTVAKLSDNMHGEDPTKVGG